MSDVFIRKMKLEDIDDIMVIEHASFTSPWSKQSFEMELKENNYAHYYVIGDSTGIFGYCGLWVVIDTAQITNIAILPTHRGKKYGELLFTFVLQKARELGALELSLEVRITNIVAQRLYRKYGMKPVGIRKNYYVDNQEDAIIMWVKL